MEDWKILKIFYSKHTSRKKGHVKEKQGPEHKKRTKGWCFF